MVLTWQVLSRRTSCCVLMCDTGKGAASVEPEDYSAGGITMRC